MADSDDEPVTLSAHALAALAEFNAEKDAHQSRFNDLKAQAGEVVHTSMTDFTEDWNESQFWYSDDTADLLAKQLLDGFTSKTHIGVVSAPSVFVALRNIVCTYPANERPKITLLEHDDRFSVFSEFVYYDFQQPLTLPGELKGSMDCIICDPPFLSEDCQTKAALTARWLLKSINPGDPLPRLIINTGERMQHLVTKLYRFLGVRTTDFEPKHARGLSNEFYCYANFECTAWSWRM